MNERILDLNRDYFEKLYGKKHFFLFALNAFFSFNQKSKSKVNMRIIRAAFDQLGKHFPPRAVLDFGCGFGNLLFTFPRCTRIYGADISPSCVAYCTKLLKLLRRQGEFIVSDGRGSMPWTDGSFDVIISSHTLEHLVDERRTIREFVRCLRKGAFLLINVPINEVNSDEKHAREYSQKHLERLFHENGLQLVLFEECDRFNGFLVSKEGQSIITKLATRFLRAVLALFPERVWRILDRFARNYPNQQLIGVAKKP